MNFEGVLPGGGSFLCFLVTRAVDIVSYQMVTVAIGWQMYDITRSAFYLGLVGLVQFMPSTVAGILCWSRGRPV